MESPTGTGKTLSLLCSTLTWLTDNAERANKVQVESFRSSLNNDGDPDWVHEQALAAHIRQFEVRKEELQERLERAKRKEEELKRKSMANVVHKRQRTEKKSEKDHELEDEDADFLPVDDDGNEDGITPELRALMTRVENSRRKQDTDETEEVTCTKVYYASRTHSQLAQLRSELLKTSHKSRIVPLGSRKNLCINEELRAKGDTATELDEGCRELLNEKKGKRCPYLPPHDAEHQILEFRDHVLATPRDIEDLVTLGKELETCPYFGSRRAIPLAELVTLPYNLLLQSSAREALGIDLTGHVVVIDEAHNLIDTLLSIHTTVLSFQTLETSIIQLTTYLEKFKKRLTAIHALHLRRLLRFLVALKNFLVKWKANLTVPATDQVYTPSQLMNGLGSHIEGINLLEIKTYLKQSKIARKISGYSDKEAEKAAGVDPKQAAKLRRRSTPPLHAVEAFILALSDANTDGCMLISADKSNLSIKYQLLNPSNHFKTVLEAARCVILAGGTMAPISDFQFQLFPFLSTEQYSVYTCGHVIPSSNIRVIVAGKGPKGGDLTFKYKERDNVEMISELGQVIGNLVNLIPHGLVVFFPSYAFLNVARKAFQENGFLDRLEGKKKVFFEPESSSDVDDVLRQYALAIASVSTTASKKGALLFAVVGAKLSEGINFSDSLARGVVIVGLPFPSLGSVELRERMRYVTGLAKTSKLNASGSGGGTKDAGMELYENICMRSVNQSIGRAIRHKNDYATLVLVDSRYGSSQIRTKLPAWIGKETVVANSFGEVVREISTFFRTKQ